MTQKVRKYNTQNLKPFTGRDDPRRANGPKRGTEQSRTRLKRFLELTEKLKNPVTAKIEDFTVLEQLDLGQIVKAKRGDTRAYNAILDRLEGKPVQSMELTGADGGPLQMLQDDPRVIETLIKTVKVLERGAKTANDLPKSKG